MTSVSVHDQNAKVWKIGDYLERIGKINITVTILNDNFYFFYWGGSQLGKKAPIFHIPVLNLVVELPPIKTEMKTEN